VLRSKPKVATLLERYRSCPVALERRIQGFSLGKSPDHRNRFQCAIPTSSTGYEYMGVRTFVTWTEEQGCCRAISTVWCRARPRSQRGSKHPPCRAQVSSLRAPERVGTNMIPVEQDTPSSRDTAREPNVAIDRSPPPEVNNDRRRGSGLPSNLSAATRTAFARRMSVCKQCGNLSASPGNSLPRVHGVKRTDGQVGASCPLQRCCAMRAPRKPTPQSRR
jgi:hypothetical protein